MKGHWHSLPSLSITYKEASQSGKLFFQLGNNRYFDKHVSCFIVRAFSCSYQSMNLTLQK